MRVTIAGALLGALVGAGWWYGFVCTACGVGKEPLGVLVFSTVAGALMARRFSADWGPPEIG